MRKISAILLLLPSVAWAFPFEVEQQLNGAEVDVQTMDLGNNMAAVSLQNYGQSAAVCKVRLRSGPEAPRTRQAQVKPGESAHVTARFNSTVIRTRVRVECQLD